MNYGQDGTPAWRHFGWWRQHSSMAMHFYSERGVSLCTMSEYYRLYMKRTRDGSGGEDCCSDCKAILQALSS